MFGINFLEVFLIFNCSFDEIKEESVIQKLIEWELIPRVGDYLCPSGHQMRIMKDSPCRDGFKWRCLQTNKKKGKRCEYK